MLFILGVTGCSMLMTTRETGAVIGTAGRAVVGIVGGYRNQIQALQNRQWQLEGFGVRAGKSAYRVGTAQEGIQRLKEGKMMIHRNLNYLALLLVAAIPDLVPYGVPTTEALAAGSPAAPVNTWSLFDFLNSSNSQLALSQF